MFNFLTIAIPQHTSSLAMSKSQTQTQNKATKPRCSRAPIGLGLRYNTLYTCIDIWSKPYSVTITQHGSQRHLKQVPLGLLGAIRRGLRSLHAVPSWATYRSLSPRLFGYWVRASEVSRCWKIALLRGWSSPRTFEFCVFDAKKV